MSRFFWFTFPLIEHDFVFQKWRRLCEKYASYKWTLQHTAPHCNTLKHISQRCRRTFGGVASYQCVMQPAATHCNTLQRTATHAATPCNTLERIAFHEWVMSCTSSASSLLDESCLPMSHVSEMSHVSKWVMSQKWVMSHSLSSHCCKGSVVLMYCSVLQRAAVCCSEA